jgi:uncharacterized membrane protein YuzA (DUF378 family)
MAFLPNMRYPALSIIFANYLGHTSCRSLFKEWLMVTMHTWYRIALVLVIIGALNWGLIGFFGFDLVSYIFGGQNAMASRIIYAVVGIAGLLSLGLLFQTEERV